MKLLAVILSIFYFTTLRAITPDHDTIKIYAGDRQLIIITNTPEDQKNNLKAGLDDFKALIEKTKRENDSIQKVIDSLTAIAKAGDNSEQIQEQIQELKEQLKENQKFIDALNKGIDDIKNQISTIEKEIEEKKQKLENDEDCCDDHDYYYDNGDEFFKGFKRKHIKNKFDGHWSGCEIGLNYFLDENYKPLTSSILAPSPYNSIQFNINFLESKLFLTPFLSAPKLGIITGIGLRFNNYKYDDFPYYDENYILIFDSTHAQYDPNGEIKRITLKSFTIRMPLLLELQLDRRGKFYINAGPYIGLVADNKLKIKYYTNSKEKIIKYNINPLINPITYGLTGKIGFDRIQIFADLTLNSFFKNTQNPTVLPVSVGIVLLN